jgi:NAD(P)-dependent dehydrogenase (short-subunit alcohol dehydrogenase family)
LGLSDALQVVYLDGLDDFGGFQGEGFRGPGFGFESCEFTFAGDLSVAAAAETLLQRFPLVDILVNSLGIFEPKPFVDISDEEWRRFFEVNVLSGVRLSRA